MKYDVKDMESNCYAIMENLMFYVKMVTIVDGFDFDLNLLNKIKIIGVIYHAVT